MGLQGFELQKRYSLNAFPDPRLSSWEILVIAFQLISPDTGGPYSKPSYTTTPA